MLTALFTWKTNPGTKASRPDPGHSDQVGTVAPWEVAPAGGAGIATPVVSSVLTTQDQPA